MATLPPTRPAPEVVVRINRIWHDVEAEHYDRVHHEIITDEAEHWRKLAAKAAVCLPQGPATVVDIGTGTGFAMASFWPYLRPGDTAVCLDISVPMLGKAAARLESLGGPIPPICAACDASGIPLPSGRAHVVLMNSVLHHMPEPEKVLAEVCRLLAPGGMFVLAHEPNARARTSPHAVALYLAYRAWRKLRRLAKSLYGHKGQAAEVPKDLYEEVIRRLREQKVITKDQQVDWRWISQAVDFHSPTAGGAFLRQGGFDPSALIEQQSDAYEASSIETYAHLGKIRPSGWLLGLLDRLLGRLFPRSGASFSLVARKAEAIAGTKEDAPA